MIIYYLLFLLLLLLFIILHHVIIQGLQETAGAQKELLQKNIAALSTVEEKTSGFETQVAAAIAPLDTLCAALKEQLQQLQALPTRTDTLKKTLVSMPPAVRQSIETHTQV